MEYRLRGKRRLGLGQIVSLERIHLAGPEGKAMQHDLVVHPGGVGVVAVTDGEVWLVEQYRSAVGKRILEIPAGKLDPDDSDPAQAATRELAEETGLQAERVERLGELFSSPGFCNEVIHLFVAVDPVAGERRPEGSIEESSRVVRLPLGEALDLVESGEITDAKTQIALLRYALGSTGTLPSIVQEDPR